ncbi:hypothetical protein [Nocardia jinanensis]|uniref:Uncharacterized protein n=1 Tax=Nocardia jinanensis TaxID=382504 RepID=A0A917RQQ6_9NOCA|nr:hypothetical protein [Nocardia jinanensis]GGL19795.1 hypothetical protein GCM10011588_38130 [Nocardia jinanensis]
MGLDVYAVRPSQSRVTDSGAFRRLQEMSPAERGEFGWLHPAELEPFHELPREFATGGVFWPSDGDPTGIRGQVYDEWVSDEFGLSLYELFDPEDVRGLLRRLDDWLERAGNGEVTVPLFGHDSDDGYALSRVRSLVAFLRATAAQELWLFPDY